MPRTRVQASDVAAAIASALNNLSQNGGQLKAVANGVEVKVTAHGDAPGASYNDIFCVTVR